MRCTSARLASRPNGDATDGRFDETGDAAHGVMPVTAGSVRRSGAVSRCRSIWRVVGQLEPQAGRRSSGRANRRTSASARERSRPSPTRQNSMRASVSSSPIRVTGGRVPARVRPVSGEQHVVDRCRARDADARRRGRARRLRPQTGTQSTSTTAIVAGRGRRR